MSLQVKIIYCQTVDHLVAGDNENKPDGCLLTQSDSGITSESSLRHHPQDAEERLEAGVPGFLAV